jgi:hypothetical protein
VSSSHRGPDSTGQNRLSSGQLHPVLISGSYL